MRDFVILIPCFCPDEALCAVVSGLREVGFSRFVIVDDGSTDASRALFQSLASDTTVILRHEVNRGKGAALKTGFSYIEKSVPDAAFVITVDGDNQHRAQDVAAVAAAAKAHPNEVILGARNFSMPQVPPKSRVGNSITRFSLRFFCGIRLRDTQTGLRSFPRAVLEPFLKVAGDHYEYETNLLLEMKTRGIAFREVPIETVYYDANAKTSFHPFWDSFRIYRLILRFALSSFFCTFLDNGAFLLLHLLLSAPLGVYTVPVCTVAARILSSGTNYLINRSLVFARREKHRRTLLRYYAVAVPQLLLSAGGLWLITEILRVQDSFWATLLKICIDFILFLISFRLQRDWVFGKGTEYAPSH